MAQHNFLMLDGDFSENDYCLRNYVNFNANKSIVDREWRKEHQGRGLGSAQNMCSQIFLSFPLILQLGQDNGNGGWLTVQRY